ncbi:thymidine phosphorylase, partial [Pseudomonas fluorescens ABAC62]
MHNDGKVVPINRAHATPSPLARLPVVLLQVRDKAAQQLQNGLQELFDNADDTLFEMADKARSNADHHIFFEAMRDLRLKRKNFERVFMERLFEAFGDLGQSSHGELQMPPVRASAAASGLSRDELEKAVALEAMLGRVRHRDGLALGQLTTRLSALLGNHLNDRENPLGPALLCEFFLHAGRSLGVEIRVKLIILKLFEKYVLSNADQLYWEANQLLRATGVLPELKAVPCRLPGERLAVDCHREAALPSAEQPVDESDQQAFTALQALLAAERGSVAPTLEASADPQPIATRDLLRLLSHLQQYVPAPDAEDDFDLRNQLGQLLTRVSVKSGRSRVLEDADEDAINLIVLLFEFILNDRAVPDAFKPLIGRLQIPMLKVAVLDKSFFSCTGHPARRLLNEIAAAALGWSSVDDYQRDGLYLCTEQVVQRLLNEFVEDPAIFSQLLDQLTAFTADERRRCELIERHTRDAEEGRMRAESARARVADALNRRLLGKTLPPAVVQFLQQAWSHVLLLTSLKHGEQSVQWQAALRTMDELIWSVSLPQDTAAGEQLLAQLPGLLKALRDGLTNAAFDPFSTSNFFARLQTLHVQPEGGLDGLIEIREP